MTTGHKTHETRQRTHRCRGWSLWLSSARWHLSPPSSSHTGCPDSGNCANKHGCVKLTGIYCEWCNPVATGSTGRGRDTNDPEMMFDLFNQTGRSQSGFTGEVCCVFADESKRYWLIHTHGNTHKQTNTHSHFVSLKHRVNIDDVTWGFPIHTGIVWQVCFVFLCVLHWLLYGTHFRLKCSKLGIKNKILIG